MLLKYWPSPGFLAGMALASPFLADFVPWKFAGALIVIWAVGGGLHLRSVLPSLRTPLLVLPLVILAAHLAALALTDTAFANSVTRESSVALALIIVAFASKVDAKLASGFFAVVLVAALATAVLGLVKLGLQDRGYLLWFIIQQCPEQYPQGSNLCADYNLLGMLWLAAAIGAVAWRMQKGGWLPLLLTGLFITAGLAVGSRRFLVLMAIIPVFWITLAVTQNGLRRSAREITLALTVCVAGWSAVGIISDPISYERFRFGAEPMIILGAPEGFADTVKTANRAGATVIAGTILDEGLSSRIGSWRLGTGLFLEAPLIGHGFGYHEPFATKIGDDKYRGYPHLPLLSEALIGGLPLLLIAFCLYALLVGKMLKRSASLQMSGIPACFFVVTAVTSISGDTIFSIPQWLSVALVLSLVSSHQDNLDLTSSK